MVSDSDTTDDPRSGEAGEAFEARQFRRPGAVAPPREDKFPRPVRLALLLGVPILLWTGIYLLCRHLL